MQSVFALNTPFVCFVGHEVPVNQCAVRKRWQVDRIFPNGNSLQPCPLGELQDQLNAVIVVDVFYKGPLLGLKNVIYRGVFPPEQTQLDFFNRLEIHRNITIGA